MNAVKPAVGLGDPRSQLIFCVANRPPLSPYQTIQTMQPLMPGEIASIVAQTSNHWRKLFNVLAKCIYELKGETLPFASWQQYRDGQLLQANSGVALLFSAPDWSNIKEGAIHIVTGKTYASELNLPFPLTWHNNYFATNQKHRLIVSPYMDYRQLSNARITELIGYVRMLDARCET